MRQFKLLGLGALYLASLGAMVATASPMTRNLATHSDSLILEMNFENSLIKNEVTNKTYKTALNTWKSVASDKGLGFQFNNDYFDIPKADINLTENDDVVTLSFLYTHYQDADNNMYPFSFGTYNMYIEKQYIGFNTNSADLYGAKHNFVEGETYHVIAEFRKGDVTKNKIYIDGVSKSMVQVYANKEQNKANAKFGNGLAIGTIKGQPADSKYRLNSKAIVDEIMLFKKSFSQTDINKLALSHRVPELDIELKNGKVSLKWATEILDSDVIYKFDFEAGEAIPDFNWRPNKVGDATGGQKVVSNQYYRGARSVLLPRTLDAMGNNYNSSQTSSNANIMSYGQLYAPSGTKLSVAFRAKSTSGTNYITGVGDGGFSDVVYWHPTAKLAKDANQGDRSIVVTDINGIELWTNIEVTSSRSNFPGGNPPNVTKITKNSDGTYKLDLEWGIMSSAKAGSRVGYRKWRDVWAFEDEKVQDTKWKLYNSNTSIFNNSDYDVQKRGGSFHIRSKNEATVYLDDVRFGYATQVELYRDGTKVYGGYNSSFIDEGPRDKGKPVLGDISASVNMVNKPNKLAISINGSYDTGTTYNYQIKSIGRSGGETFLSKNHPIELKSGLQGYSYVLDKNRVTTPNSVVNTTSNTFELDISGPGIYYLHIKAIDNLGNSSDVEHIPITVPTLTATPNSLAGMIKLSWTSSSDSTYKVYKREAKTSNFQAIPSSTSILEDYSVDTAAPTMPQISGMKLNDDGRFTITFTPSIDRGNSYEYYVETTRSGNKMRVVTTSSLVSTSITTGIKGYSYVLDNKLKTEPDNIVEITELNQMVFTESDIGKYLHIKAVDNAKASGNSSETLHIKIDPLKLTAKAKPSQNMIRLDWTEMEESTYKLYQKKPGNTEFQSISSTTFDPNSKVRVLNVHPNKGSVTTCTTWDGEQVSVPASANLKCWMEAPNNLSSRGYGKGVIEVDVVTIEDFSANPTAYLKTSNGEWLYDVVMFGTWDANDYKDISEKARDVMDDFLSEGRGVLFGHDTANSNNKWSNFTYLGSKYCNLVNSGADSPRLSKIKITKRGLLTNYPWEVGDLGQELTIPLTHSYGQDAYGDIWMRYVGGAGNRNDFYLTSWNNCAMIQTGHSNGSATQDEQKLLANTLFYLNQLSTNNFLDDYSGQDVAAPTKPSVKSISYTMDNKINVVINPSKDNGSTYEYYVESERKDASFKATSNKVSETITTGLAGYSYVVDNNSDTIPDNRVDTTSTTIQIPTNNKGRYFIHIKAVDNVGNVSDTIHYELTDTTKPSLVVTANTTNWTNQDVVLTAVAQDNESGLKYIHLPNNTKVTKNSVTYTVSANGTYAFKAEDFMGNIQVVNKAVSNIDKIAPTGSVVIANGESKLQSEETTLTLQFSDNLSGVAKVEVYDLDMNGNPLSSSHIINNPSVERTTIPWVLKEYDVGGGIQKARVGMTITDKAGNSKKFVSQEVIIEKIKITGLTLTDVVNPDVYNEQNPFVPLSYPNIPPQKMLSGGSFKFRINYDYSPTIPTSYRVDCIANIYYVGANGYSKVSQVELNNQRLTGVLEMTHEIEFGIPNGTNIYIDVQIKLKTDTGRLYGEDFFPKPQGSRLHLGVIDGDIREIIRFNEIK